MSDNTYVAVHALKWGDGWLKAGEIIPEEEGRNIGLMLRLGQAVVAQEGAADLKALQGKLDEAETQVADYVSVVGELLPSDYPGRAALFGARVYSEAHVAELGDDALRAIKGIGEATFNSVRERTPLAAPGS